MKTKAYLRDYFIYSSMAIFTAQFLNKTDRLHAQVNVEKTVMSL